MSETKKTPFNAEQAKQLSYKNRDENVDVSDYIEQIDGAIMRACEAGEFELEEYSSIIWNYTTGQRLALRNHYLSQGFSFKNLGSNKNSLISKKSKIGLKWGENNNMEDKLVFCADEARDLAEIYRHGNVDVSNYIKKINKEIINLCKMGELKFLNYGLLLKDCTVGEKNAINNHFISNGYNTLEEKYIALLSWNFKNK